MEQNYKDKNYNFYEEKEELFLNEYNWESTKDEFDYFFKIRLNTNNTILLSCSTINLNNDKLIFENNYSIKDLHNFDRFKNNENVNDIYIFLLTMIQDNQFEFEQKQENELMLKIKPYTNYEKAFEFILHQKLNNKNCGICDRIHSGINYLRFIRDNNNSHNNNHNHNHNIISSNNNISYNINCNYSNINKDIIDDKNIISKIMEEINFLKKENQDKNEQIINLKKQLIEQNIRLSQENKKLKEEINNINNNNDLNNIKIDENKIMLPTLIPLKPLKKININNEYKDNNIFIKNTKGKKIFLKTFKTSYEIFKKNPNELKYNNSIVNNLSAKGVNDIFEVFTSTKDNQAYLISKNAKTHCLDIISLNSLNNYTIINSLYGHKNTITMVRYFMNYKGKNEYLISADIDKNVIVWDITNNYNILHFIKTEYINVYIYSCYIFFDNFDNNYIFTSCGLNRYIKNDTSYTKIYSFKDGIFNKNIIDSNENNTYYLLMWYNEISKINYLIELCEEKIIITNFMKNELYAKLLPIGFKVLKYYSGFIHTVSSGKDWLCCSTSNGCIAIWDLFAKQIVYYKKISKVELYNIIPWSLKYLIISGGSNKSIKIFDIEIMKEVNNIKTEHSSNINCIKKIMHPTYGECLLTSGNDHQIKLWKI